MFNLISIIIGVVALLGAIIAFIPLLGIANYLVVPLALVGLLFGIFAERSTGRNLNLVVIVVGVLRLIIGGGIL